MHLMLRVESDATDRATDLVATVEPTHTVDQLRRALVAFPGLGAGANLRRRHDQQLLEPTATLAEVGLVSGEVLALSAAGGTFDADRPAATVRIEATGGPAAGWRVDLGPGTHLLGRPGAGTEHDPSYQALPDGTVSQAHVQITVAQDLTVSVVENPEATNALLVDGVRPAGLTVLEPTTELRLGDSVLACSRVEPVPEGRIDQLGQVAFHRTPLRPSRPEPTVLPVINKVPTTPEPARFSWLSSAAPLLGGILMALALQEPRFLIFTMLAPVTGAAGFFENRKRNRQRFARDCATFEKRLAEREEAYAAAFEEEQVARLEGAPDIADLRRRAERRDRTLWSRGRHIPEFLSLRVGTGPAEPDITAEFSSDGDEEPIAQLEALAARFERFERVPIQAELQELGVLGIHGARREVASLAKSLLLQAVCLQSPEDLVVAAAASPEMELLEWLKWLPHTHATGSPIGGAHLASDARSTNQLLRSVLDVAEFRDDGTDHGVDRRWPWMLVVIDRLIEPDPRLVAQILDRCPEVGISVIWLSDTADRVPPQCRAVAELADRAERGAEQLSKLWFTDPERPTQWFSADGVDRSLPDLVARSLAPLRDASSTTATASIPRVVPLFAAHGIDDATVGWVQQEWAVDRNHADGYSLETVVGTSSDGPLRLDLVADGPHALIGGTSGAGKSELIQALVAGLVAFQSPRDLSLMFIDFKGGSASEVFKDLPHISGRVTDLDESLALRAQVSLRAELRHRVALFSDLAAKDMADMRRLHPDEAPPSLVIVIDEFATLVKQLPDFVADIIDIAQRGRSYGVHLILATQRPSSSVDDNILANTNLRISLRMLDRTESMSVLNAPDAAEIPVPLKGRSIARLGPGQLVEFQSAYCSAPVDSRGGPPPVSLAPFGAGAPTAAAPAPSDGADQHDPTTQLDALLGAISQLGHAPVRQIWNELLPSHLPFATADTMRRVPDYARDPGRLILLGAADDPANQRQHASVVDLDSGGGLLVLGTGGSGKTTVLRTAAASACLDDQRAGGGKVAIFVLDFSSGELRSLAALPQCCGVGTLDDLEATTRIIETLDAEVTRRRSAAATAEADGEDDPRILLLVDGYANLVEALQNTRGGQEQTSEQWLTSFHRIVLDGRQLGMYSLITADRSGSVKNSIFASITRRLVLRQMDVAETNALGIPGTGTFLPGAGYLDDLRVQVASLADPGVSEDAALLAFAGILDGPEPDLLQAPLPEDLDRPPGSVGDGWHGVVGQADISGEEIAFDLTNLDVLVTGPPLSGKSWALRALAEQLEAAGRTVYAIGAEDSGLRQFTWKAAGWGTTEIEGLIGTMKAELEFPGRDAVLVVDDLDLLDGPAFDAAVAGLGPNRSLRLLGSSTSFGYSNNEVVKRVRAARQVLYLQPGSSREVAETIGVMRLPLLRMGLPFPQGRGMFVRNRVPVVVQVYRPSGVEAR